jgi:two-component system OmpR family response regulator
MTVPSTTSEPCTAPVTSPVILIVEDDPAIQRTLRRLLRASDYRVLMASSLAEAKALCTGVDLLLLDRRLPDGDGLAICSLVRAQRPAPAIIILSALNDPADIAAARAAGVQDYLTKPFAPDDLLEAVRGRLQERSQVA